MVASLGRPSWVSALVSREPHHMLMHKCLLGLTDISAKVLLECNFELPFGREVWDSLGTGEALTVIGASAVSGVFASACSLPFDYVKTKIQKMQPDADGRYPYTGSLDCAMKTMKTGGPLKFYNGFPVYFVRIARHVMVLLSLIPLSFDMGIPEPNSEAGKIYRAIEIRDKDTLLQAFV
ncbi:hypothetical protein Nepgr_021927 [Nepenthes gracilis]|uniref:Uncharacterized protein n=1 Tax=Nepenthes gracilis TaxID=150966 RepID=A0AAD3XXV9_NEPGR|nr:hypothetical protein Nepgr_021927 [Nepenthes gracilis]